MRAPRLCVVRLRVSRRCVLRRRAASPRVPSRCAPLRRDPLLTQLPPTGASIGCPAAGELPGSRWGRLPESCHSVGSSPGEPVKTYLAAYPSRRPANSCPGTPISRPGPPAARAGGWKLPGRAVGEGSPALLLTDAARRTVLPLGCRRRRRSVRGRRAARGTGRRGRAGRRAGSVRRARARRGRWAGRCAHARLRAGARGRGEGDRGR
jgi:hypothetical protein